MIEQAHFIVCDGCGTTGEMLRTAHQAWRAVAKCGWMRVRIRVLGQLRKHYCPSCVEGLDPKPEFEEPICSDAYGDLVRQRKKDGGCDTVDGRHAAPDVAGRCGYCGRKIGPPAAAPSTVPVSVLTMAYERFYDPDWGGRRRDIDA